MKRIILLVAIVIISLLTSNRATAQYRTGIGVFGGNFQGITVKQYMNTNADQSMEGLLIKDNNLWRFTGIYAWNRSVRLPGLQISGLNWHYGIGAHVGYHNDSPGPYDKNVNGASSSEIRKDGQARENYEYGIDFQIGFELLFGEIPFSIGVDVNPFYSSSFGARGYGFDSAGTPLAGGLVLRYLLD